MPEENLKHKTKIGMYWTFINQASTQIMQFVVGIVMARLLSPSDYGITALPAVFMAVAGIFMDSGFGQALIRKPEVTEKDLSTSFYYSLGMGIFMYACLFFAAPWIADFYNTPVLTPLIRVTALNFLWGPLGTPQSIILNRRLDFKTPARISIINKIVGAIVGIAAAYQGFGLWALVISGLVSSLLGLAQTWWAVKWLPKEKFSKESFKYLWGYGNKIIGVNIVDTFYNNVAPIFIGKAYSPTTLGIYNRAEGYAKLPANQITGVLTGVSFPVLSKFQDDYEALKRNYKRMVNLSCFLSFPIFMLLCALSKPLIITIITEKWESCIRLLQILCFSRMWWPMMVVNKNLLQVTGNTKYFFTMEMIKKPLLIIVTICTLPFGITIFCYGILLQTFIAIYMNSYYTNKLIKYSVWQQLRDIFPMLLVSIFTLLVVFFINLFVTNLILQIIIGGIVGTVVYFGCSFVFKFDELDDLKYMLNRR